MTGRSDNMFVVGQCHDGTDVAVYKASEDDYNNEVLTLAEAETLAAESARERGCRFFVFADMTAEVAYAIDAVLDSTPVGECAECGTHFTQDESFSATICTECGEHAERALTELAQQLAEGGLLGGADMFLKMCSRNGDPRIEAMCSSLRPAIELLYSLTERTKQ